MSPEHMEARMRQLEIYHHLRVLPQAWTILRVDGRSFSKFTQDRFEKPFDPRFHQAMVAAARCLLTELQGLYAFTESDEISVLLPRDTRLFDREQEKLVSLSASIATASLSLTFQTPVQCDSRLCVAANLDQVIDYFCWRQADATRCCLNGWCYWTLRQDGMDARQATRALHGRSVAWKNETLFQHGINFNDLPGWQKRGTAIYWTMIDKAGFNPVTGQATTTQRRVQHLDDQLPHGQDYARFLRERFAV